METLNIGTKWTSGGKAWRENTATAEVFELILVIGMRFFIELMDPFRHILIILQSCLSKVRSFIANNWQRLLIRQTLENNAEIAETVLGRVPVHLVEVGAQAGCDRIDLRLLHPVRHGCVILQEPCLLVILITEQLQLLLEIQELSLEARVRVDDVSSLSNGQNCRIERQRQFVHQKSDYQGGRP